MSKDKRKPGELAASVKKAQKAQDAAYEKARARWKATPGARRSTDPPGNHSGRGMIR